jgi:hypothetical protein
VTFLGDAIVTKLESSRREMLDVGLRNPLINFKGSKGRSLAIVDELSAEVFRILVLEGKAMTFLPSGEDGEDDGLSQPDEPEIPGQLAARHVDSRLQTSLTGPRLQDTLLSIYYAARTFIEEQGVNVLYLSLGMLEWRESPGSEERYAPLLLIPVEVSRSNAQDRFSLRYTGDDLGQNLSLHARLKQEEQIELPVLPDLEDLDLPEYYAAVRGAVAGRPHWAVRENRMALGLFSFGKFLMYKDLDSDTWPAGHKPAEHPVVQALLQTRFREAPAAVAETDHLDAVLRAQPVRHVVDSDGSQTLAILDVRQGRNMVIQGPPGTGKSQTITNMIADAVGRGQKVLFVAEKMAALEVVKRRLDQVGLGDACLELHSHKANKKAVLLEVARTLKLGSPSMPLTTDELGTLDGLRDRLNAYSEAMNAPVGASGVTPYVAIGELLMLRADEPGGVLDYAGMPFAEMAAWDGTQFQRALGLVQELQTHLARMGTPDRHPFWGVGLQVLLPTRVDALAGMITETERATAAVAAAGRALAGELELPPPPTREACQALLTLARQAGDAPDVVGVELTAPEWVTHADELAAAFAAGERLSALHAAWDEGLIPEAWAEPLLDTRRHLAAYGRQWWRFFNGDYRRAKTRLAGLCRGALPGELDAQLAMVDAVLEAQRAEVTLRAHESIVARVLGIRWRQHHTDWSGAADIGRELATLHRAVAAGQLSADIMRILGKRPALPRSFSAAGLLDTALRDHAAAVERFRRELEIGDAGRFGPIDGHLGLLFEEQAEMYHACSSSFDRLSEMVTFCHLADGLRQAGLDSVVHFATHRSEAPKRLLTTFKATWYGGLLDQAFGERPALAAFDGSTHEHAIRNFARLDQMAIAHNRLQLSDLHWRQLPAVGEGSGQLGVISKELQKKARHLPIRQLLAKAGHALQTIKPVFMMSPLSIANYLAPGGVTFDLVIFDEASQVRPVEALGAILRGRQVVVVGDSRQMPPTSFFDTLAGADADDEENTTGDIESILSLFEAQGAPSRMLRWHYRSRHESLIQVSNHEFYEGKLVVFPSPDAQRTEAGLRYHHLPAARYGRGSGATNPGEAEAVARAVMAHATTTPHLTLGVAAFSMAQMKEIQTQVDRLRRANVGTEGFFKAHAQEPFFIKNLENIQGDERDVILISIGYGWDETDKLSLAFGPLNRDGGERRLNVLITRARLRCEVFTNLDPNDIDTKRTSAKGVASLKRFLACAKDGRFDTGAVQQREPEPFARQVAQALTGAGYQIETQLGGGGMTVDLAVRDPEQPGRFVLAVSCDGPSYDQARSARDRDRLRPQVLRGLGWQTHQVWSADWFRQPARELNRLTAAIHAANTAPVAEPPAASLPGVVRELTEREAAPATPLEPYRCADIEVTFEGDMHALPAHRLARWLAQVVEVEGPVHVDEAKRRVTQAAGKKLGSRIDAALETGVALAVSQRTFARRGDFLWAIGQASPPLRSRDGLPAASRKLELVAPEELEGVAVRAVAESVGLEPEALPTEVCKRLGVTKPAAETAQLVTAAVDRLLRRGHLEARGRLLAVPAVAFEASLPAPGPSNDLIEAYAMVNLSPTATLDELQQALLKETVRWKKLKHVAITPDKEQQAAEMVEALTNLRQRYFPAAGPAHAE